MIHRETSRKNVYNIIRNSPGIHFREIQRLTGMATGNLQYHLDRLEELGLIKSERDRKYRRYYPVEVEINDKDKKIISALRRRTERLILIYLLSNPGSSLTDIAYNMYIANSTVSWHVSRLIKEGIIEKKKEGGRSMLYIRDPQKVRKLLIIYKKSFIDKLVEGFIDIWGIEWLRK